MFDISDEEAQTEKIIANFTNDLKKIRTGRAHPDMLENLKVEAYGQRLPLNQVAHTTVGDATLLIVTPYDPANIPAITAAIRADQTLGLNPADDGRIIRLPIPPLTEERRRELTKSAGAKVEAAKVAIRNVRDNARKNLKAAELPEDAKKRAEKAIDELTKKSTDQIDTLYKTKEQEIMKL